MRGRRRPRRHHHFSRIPRIGRARGGVGSASFDPSAARQPAHYRTQLPGRDVPRQRVQRHVRARARAAGFGGAHQPKRGYVHRDSGLEPAPTSGIQRLRLHRVHAGRQLGRPDRLLGRRSPHQEHRDLYGVHRERPLVPIGGARGGAEQTDHRHQGRAQRCHGQSCGVAHRVAHRQRRRVRSRLSTGGRAAGELHRRHFLYDRGAGPPTASQGSTLDDCHQCRGTGRAGGGRIAGTRRGAGRSLPGHVGDAERHPARPLEPQQPHRHDRRRRAGSLRQHRGGRGARPRFRRVAGDHGAPGLNPPGRHRGQAQALRQDPRQTHPGQLDGRRGSQRRRGRAERRRNPDVPLPRYGRPGVPLHVAL